MADESDFDAFLTLSSALTGFGRFDLDATGQAAAYFEQVTANIGKETLVRLFETWRAIEYDLPENERAQALADRVLAVEPLQEAARRIIMLWYVGSWYFVAPYGANVISPASYVEGLMWKAIGSHPMAGKPQGYGAWALPPPSAS